MDLNRGIGGEFPALVRQPDIPRGAAAAALDALDQLLIVIGALFGLGLEDLGQVFAEIGFGEVLAFIEHRIAVGVDPGVAVLAELNGVDEQAKRLLFGLFGGQAVVLDAFAQPGLGGAGGAADDLLFQPQPRLKRRRAALGMAVQHMNPQHGQKHDQHQPHDKGGRGAGRPESGWGRLPGRRRDAGLCHGLARSDRA